MAYNNREAKALKDQCEGRGLIQSGKMSQLKLKRKLSYNENEEHNGSDSTKIPANKMECSICREHRDTSKFGATMHKGIAKSEEAKQKQICLICCRYHILSKLNDNISRDNIICPAENCNTCFSEDETHKLPKSDANILKM